MPKKRQLETDLSRLIRGVKLSLAEFARTIGVSASTIKKLVEGKRPMSQELKARIFAETGVIFVDGKPDDEPLIYSKQDYQEFKKETAFNEKAAIVAAGLIAKQVELLLIAASRPTVGKSLPIFTALQLALNNIKNEYHLEKSIDAVLRERHATQTKLYSVKELRENDLLAKQVGFMDNPELKDDEHIALSKTVGWLPAKDCFNVMWQNRELLKELLNSNNQELAQAQKNQLQTMLSQIDHELDAFMPAFKDSTVAPKPPPASD